MEFFKHQNDLKTTWKLLRTVMQIEDKKVNQITLKINGLLVENPETIANSFNNYFVTIASELSNALPEYSGSFEEFLSPSRSNSMGCLLTSPEEILKISASLKKTHSRGLDDIDPYLATPNINLITKPLSSIINCSLLNGIVPTKIKMAKVVPIFKKGDAENPANYRPISVLPYFSKYFEKIVYDRLSNYITEYGLIHQTQHGFQKGHSTYMALIDMEDRITKAIDANEFAVGIFIDLAKAFDTVDHTLLLKKLDNLGIRGPILKWFHSYLQERTQMVLCNDVLSEGREIMFGVPQGSNVSPLLFLIYINDLANISKNLYFILFADDTNIFFAHHSWEILLQRLNNELTLVNNWFLANRLTLNIDKTNFILFRSHRKPRVPVILPWRLLVFHYPKWSRQSSWELLSIVTCLGKTISIVLPKNYPKILALYIEFLTYSLNMLN